MRHICLYIGVQIFIACVRVYGRAGPPEVVQEALADLKSKQTNDMITINQINVNVQAQATAAAAQAMVSTLRAASTHSCWL